MTGHESRVDNNLDKVLLGGPAMRSTPEPTMLVPIPIKPPPSDKDHDKDYSEVRDNLKRVIIQSESAIQGILQVAEETQNARAYEVAAQLIQATLEANNKLMHLHKQLKEIKKEDAVKQTNVTNNSIFVGNTSELSKFLKARKELEKAVKPEDIIDAE